MTLTTRQSEVLEYLRRHLDEKGVPPTRAEIAAALGFRSANAAEQHLRALARKGAIRLLPGASRGICLNVATGLPCRSWADAVEEGHDDVTEPHLKMDPRLFTPPAECLIQYVGPPLRAFSILSGDWLAICADTLPEDGQLVLVRLREQLTVKRYKQKGTRGYLLADGPDAAAFMVSGRDGVVVEGVIAGVVRLLNGPVESST